MLFSNFRPSSSLLKFDEFGATIGPSRLRLEPKLSAQLWHHVIDRFLAPICSFKISARFVSLPTLLFASSWTGGWLIRLSAEWSVIATNSVSSFWVNPSLVSSARRRYDWKMLKELLKFFSAVFPVNWCGANWQNVCALLRMDTSPRKGAKIWIWNWRQNVHVWILDFHCGRMDSFHHSGW